MRGGAFVTFLAVWSAACQSHAASPAAGAVPALDTLRGTVALTGAVPLTHLVLRPALGGEAVPLVGDSLALLRSVIGLDVRLVGTRGAKAFEVRGLQVVALRDTPVYDGKLSRAGNALDLVLYVGERIPISNPPPELIAHAGWRAWILFAPDGSAAQYGLLTPP